MYSISFKSLDFKYDFKKSFRNKIANFNRAGYAHSTEIIVKSLFKGLKIFGES